MSYRLIPWPLLFFVVAFWLWQRDRNVLAFLCAVLGGAATVWTGIGLLAP